MAKDEKQKLIDWNLRGFPETLKLRCQGYALEKKYEISKSGKKVKDAEVVAHLLRKIFPNDT